MVNNLDGKLENSKIPAVVASDVNDDEVEIDLREILQALKRKILLILMVFVVPAFAADDPLQVVNNLSDFIFSLIRAIGLILLGFGILQIGLALKSHDASQRANGMLTVAGGIVITFTKEILSLITGG